MNNFESSGLGADKSSQGERFDLTLRAHAVYNEAIKYKYSDNKKSTISVGDFSTLPEFKYLTANDSPDQPERASIHLDTGQNEQDQTFIKLSIQMLRPHGNVQKEYYIAMDPNTEIQSKAPVYDINLSNSYTRTELQLRPIEPDPVDQDDVRRQFEQIISNGGFEHKAQEHDEVLPDYKEPLKATDLNEMYVLIGRALESSDN